MNLYPFQRKGRDFLASRRRAYLADEMGLGKTVQAVTAASSVDSKYALVVCPASAVPNWYHEWETWGGSEDVDVVSYSTLIRRNHKGISPPLVILDEAHYAKTPSAKRTRAALGLARRAVASGGRAWLLSGTPMPNDPTELWPPIKYLWPELATELDISTARQWMETFCLTRPTIYGPKPYAVKNGKALREIVRRIMLRRTLDDVELELPELRTDLIRLPKSRAAERALSEYEDLEADEASYTSTLRRVLGGLKAPLIARQVIEELDNGAYEKVVILYHHKDVRRELKEVFEDASYDTVGFHGGTPQAIRQMAIEAFQHPRSRFRVFLAQQTAAGIAINLTAANEVVLVEPAWTPAVNEQALKRIHRIGQDKPCRARIFAISGTLDEAIMGTIAQKTKMLEEVGL